MSKVYEKCNKNKQIVKSDTFKYLCGIAAALDETMLRIKKGFPLPKDTSSIPLPPVYDISSKGFEQYVMSSERRYKEALTLSQNREAITEIFIDIASLMDSIIARL